MDNLKEISLKEEHRLDLSYSERALKNKILLFFGAGSGEHLNL